MGLKTRVTEGFDFCKDKEIICGGFKFPNQLIKETADKWSFRIRNENRMNNQKENKSSEVMYLTNTEINELIETRIFFYSKTKSYGFSPTEIHSL